MTQLEALNKITYEHPEAVLHFLSQPKYQKQAENRLDTSLCEFVSEHCLVEFLRWYLGDLFSTVCE